MTTETRADETGTSDPGRPARLIDVARRANVSRATAARALGGYGLVNDETRDRVMKAALDLDYKVNEIARAMRSGRTLTIGVVVADISNSFFNTTIRSITEGAREAGYQVLLLNTDDDLQREQEAYQVLVEKRIDGAIVVPSSPRSFSDLAGGAAPAIPTVLLDRHLAGVDHLASVTTNDLEAARQAIAHFVEMGHRRIGLLVASAGAPVPTSRLPEEAVSTVRERSTGAIAAMRELGITVDEALIRYCRNDLDVSAAAALEIIQAENPPTAVLTTNEDVALGFVSACRQLGLGIGEDVSLVCFDDVPWAAVHSPPITTVRRPVFDLGAAALLALLRQIQGKGATGSLRFSSELIIRRSVRDLRRSR